ncbi:hypothetical protein PILCRDRAFT_821778 [Piloderma croceum F 1598]|uniref:T6SS Phospholipase effector Tle1-like catalytic domain-containing protein n=1 Tax=Piloderma croceum (strain F 1598) TaxID=765440 RepID=A0A0C3BVD0_PILCF|nr:hypothetical protein PILCRDRAFT_821778 [Piloderma croceum F 1598]
MSNDPYIYFFLETGKTRVAAVELNPDTASIPALIRKVVHTQKTQFFDGVGTTQRTSSNLLQRCFYFPLRVWYQATGFDMKDKILEAWISTEGRQNDKVILMGCSRGGYSAQILAQVVNHYGYPTPGDPESNKHLQVCIRKRILSSTAADVRNISVYALDPVGSHGGLTTPARCLGFGSKTLPAGLRARVILMAGEGRIGFRPNIYDSNSNLLEQVWFDGEHGDAWCLSASFRSVLAYILGDMCSNGVRIKDHLLQPIQHQPRRLGFLSKPLLWQRRYSCPLPPNQVRHNSCSRISDDNESIPSLHETHLLTLI